MFYASNTMATLWRLTGLHGIFEVKHTSFGPSSSRLSVIYAAAVYSAYAFLYASCASDRLTAYYGRARLAESGGLLQIRLIRDIDAAVLFVTTTVVYWSVAVYSREHKRVHDEHVTVARRLLGDVAGRLPLPSSHRVMDAYCWALYALLAVVLLLDLYHCMVSVAPYTYSAVYVWGHYALLTGNVQFAVTVLALRQCYFTLNERMRAGQSERCRWDSLFVIKTSTLRTSTSSDFLSRDVMFVSVLDKVNLVTMLKYWSDLHWSITQIVSRVNNLFKFRLFVFFLCGLLHLMFIPYLLSLTILNEDIDILPHITERILWFIIHIFRVVLMIYPCALLGEEAAKTQILLGRYLNTKIDFFDIKKVEIYVQQLDVNKPEFSIYSMFVINKQLVITLTGTVATYLVIILQLQGQS